ncbi:hypothetical protein BC829DRAFT_400487 [Chytridium lagenaria]|nr:hypothetical protein BC829DRAFT_400487 [Chytridium lagenaria]
MPQIKGPPKQAPKKPQSATKSRPSPSSSVSYSSSSSASRPQSSRSALSHSAAISIDTQDPASKSYRLLQQHVLRETWLDRHRRKHSGKPITDASKRAEDALKELTVEQAILDAVRIGCDGFVKKEIPGGWEGLNVVLRRIKEKFVGRNYEGIFGTEDDGPAKEDSDDISLSTQLVAYAAGYSAGRSLCYWDLLTGLPELRSFLADGIWKPSDDAPVNVLALGAGPAAEVAGIAAACSSISTETTATLSESQTARGINVHILDIADYQEIAHSIAKTSRDMFGLPQNLFNVSYSRGDILSQDPEKQTDISTKISSANLITAMFLLNELLGSSKKEFVRLVGTLVSKMKPGAFLLVVDSAGSFSEVTVGLQKKDEDEVEDLDPTRKVPAPVAGKEQARTYMVYHLLDQIKAFDVIAGVDSRWYRYPTPQQQPDLTYPAKLHNMRHFVRLYRKKEDV